MHVAGRKLSKRLYKLTGWQDTDKAWLHFKNNPQPTLWDAKQAFASFTDAIPAYDLGYLYRQLAIVAHDKPRYLVYEISVTPVHCVADKSGWSAMCLLRGDTDENSFYAGYSAGTPEDALCGLICDLITSGYIALEDK